MAVSVAVTVGDAADRLLERLVPRVQSLKVGPGTDPDSEMGPLVTKAHYDKVRSYVDLGVEEGAELLVDGRELALQGYENGYFLGGTVFDKVTTDMRLYREEIFGPVLSVVRVPDFDSARRMVDAHEFGNGTAIFTRDGDAARAFASSAKPSSRSFRQASRRASSKRRCQCAGNSRSRLPYRARSSFSGSVGESVCRAKANVHSAGA